MTAHPTVILNSNAARERAAKTCHTAPLGTVVTYRPVKRSVPQNDRLHAMLTEISRKVKYHGQTLSVDDWKILFMSALNQEMRLVPALNNNGFVALGRSTSKLSMSEFSDLMELITAWAAQNGVVFAEKDVAA